MRLRWILVVALVCCAPRAAWAGWGEENVPLYKILWENMQQSFHLADIKHLASETVAAAEDTARHARASLAASLNVRGTLPAPEAHLAQALLAWQQSFPQLTDVFAAAWLQADAAQMHNGDILDIHAFDARQDHMLDDAHTFEFLAHSRDPLGINDPHDRGIEILTAQYAAAQDNLADLGAAMQRRGVSPIEAGLWTAKATSVAAVAQVHAAAVLERMARTMELQYANDEAARATQAAFAAEQAQLTQAHRLDSWSLQGAP